MLEQNKNKTKNNRDAVDALCVIFVETSVVLFTP